MILAMLQATAGALLAKDPFFTNDILGLAKLAGLVAAIVIPILYVVYRVTFSSVSQKTEKNSDDINALGSKVDAKNASSSARGAEIAGIDKRLSATEQEIRQIIVGQAKLETSIHEMQRQSSELQQDVMSAITTSAGKITDSVTQLQIEVARQGERNKIGETLADSLSEIADLVRQTRDNQPPRPR